MKSETPTAGIKLLYQRLSTSKQSKNRGSFICELKIWNKNIKQPLNFSIKGRSYKTPFQIWRLEMSDEPLTLSDQQKFLKDLIFRLI